MCGRFSLRVNRNNVQHQPNYNLDIDEWEDEDGFVPRYNIAPRSNAPVVRRRDSEGTSGSASTDHGASSSGSNNTTNPGGSSMKLQTMRWGLIPHWAQAEDKTLSTTNARSENLIEGGGMWRSIKGRKRCAIPCQGYYEWLNRGKDKLPHFTKRKDGALLMMAGLYDCATIEGRKVWTFAIVTTDANSEFSWLHDRQPVFLMTREAIDKWLDTTSQTWTQDLSDMVKPYHHSVPLECYQVPKEVGKVGTESPTFIEPVTARKDGIQAMFAKQKQKGSGKSSTAKTKDESSAIQGKGEPPTTEAASNANASGSSPSKKRSRTPISVGDDDVEEHEAKRAKVEMKGSKYIPRSPKSPKRMKTEPPRSPTKSRASPKRGSPKKMANAGVGSAKITSFFSKGKP